MLLNHLPINFTAQEFSGFSVPYESADTLKRLRKDLQMAKEEEDPRILPMFSRRLAGRVKQVVGDTAHSKMPACQSSHLLMPSSNRTSPALSDSEGTCCRTAMRHSRRSCSSGSSKYPRQTGSSSD